MMSHTYLVGPSGSVVGPRAESGTRNPQVAILSGQRERSAMLRILYPAQDVYILSPEAMFAPHPLKRNNRQQHAIKHLRVRERCCRDSHRTRTLPCRISSACTL